MATYYINADTGNNTTGDGTQGNPWLTFSYAITNSVEGDTIFCQNSTNTYLYNGNTINQRVVEGESVSSVIFTNESAVGAGWGIGSNKVATIKNITFSDIEATGSFTQLFGNNVGSTLIFENCIFRNISGTAPFYLFYSNTYYQFNFCLFYGFTSSYLFRMDFRSTNGVITFVNSIIHNDTTESANTILFQGNLSVTLNITNCILYNSTESTASFRDSNSIYNYSYNCRFGGYNFIPSGDNNINTDPLFIDPDNNNYNLSPSSPCIDAGTLI
jgi:hypothetical protein